MTKGFKVYGMDGHRQRSSFGNSLFFKTISGGVVEVLNEDITGTNDYSVIIITTENEEMIKDALNGQISDGIFKNSRTGLIKEVYCTTLFKLRTTFLDADGPSTFYYDTKDKATSELVSLGFSVINGEVERVRIVTDYQPNYFDGCTLNDLTYGNFDAIVAKYPEGRRMSIYDILKHIEQNAIKYSEDEYDLFAAEYGWEDWMCDFVEDLTAAELKPEEKRIIDNLMHQGFEEAQKQKHLEEPEEDEPEPEEPEEDGPEL